MKADELIVWEEDVRQIFVEYFMTMLVEPTEMYNMLHYFAFIKENNVRGCLIAGTSQMR